jgi:hypothetical protein
MLLVWPLAVLLLLLLLRPLLRPLLPPFGCRLLLWLLQRCGE